MTLEQLDKIEAAAEKYGDVSRVLIPILKSSLRETLQERDDANAEIERLRGIVEVNDQRLAAVWDESRAEVERLREIVKTAGDRLRACAYQMTEHAYQEMASTLFDLPASADGEP